MFEINFLIHSLIQIILLNVSSFVRSLCIAELLVNSDNADYPWASWACSMNTSCESNLLWDSAYGVELKPATFTNMNAVVYSNNAMQACNEPKAMGNHIVIDYAVHRTTGNTNMR